MFLSTRKVRNFFSRAKMRHRSTFYIHFIIIFITCAFIVDKLFIDKRNFRKKITVQNDLLSYNEDRLRPGWPFQITKHYDVNDLRPYTSKPKILAKYDLPGEKGA